VCLCFFSNTAFSQAKTGFENYNFLGQGQEYVWMPVVHYQAKKGFYTELRYNYEDFQTLSLYGGKTFGGGDHLQYSFTPMVGISTGKFKGISFAMNTETEWKNFYVSSQTQYSKGIQKNSNDFFFNWSELGYTISRNFFGGVALQFTREGGTNDPEPGFLAGLNLGNISIPVYLFRPFNQGRYFIVGLNYEFDFKNKKKG
jgi:hypothetical protein